MSTTYLERHATEVRAASGLDILAGIWLVIAPFVLNYSAHGGSTANDVVVGIVVLLLAGYQAAGENYRTSWPSWVNTLLGLWLIATPFLFSFPSGSAAMWNDVILGIIVGGSALVGAMMVPADDTDY